MSIRGKMVCPDCLREIGYAAERGGQATSCPHCDAPVRLPVVAARTRVLRSRAMLERLAEEEDKAPHSRFDDRGPELFQPAAFALFFGVIALLLCGAFAMGGEPWLVLLLTSSAIVSGFAGFALAAFAGVNIWLNREIYSGWAFAVAGVVLSVVFGMVVPWSPALRSFQQVNTRSSESSLLENFSRVAAAHFLHADGNGGKLPADIVGADGKPLLSWRVALLPLLGEQELHAKFRLDEPWNSPDNLKLIPLMPSHFRCTPERLNPGQTVCLHVLGPGTVFGDGKSPVPLALFDAGDGRSGTAFLVQGRTEIACDWTQPSDWNFLPDSPASSLSKLEPEGLTALGDGQVVRIDAGLDSGQRAAWFTVSGGEKSLISPEPVPPAQPAPVRQPEGG